MGWCQQFCHLVHAFTHPIAHLARKKSRRASGVVNADARLQICQIYDAVYIVASILIMWIKWLIKDKVLKN